MHSGEHEENVKLLPALYRMTKVQRRASVLLDADSQVEVRQSFYGHSVGPEDRGPSTLQRMQTFAEHAGNLATLSSRSALDDARVDGSEVTHLVVVTCTGFQSPGVDIDLIENLGLPLSVQRVQVGFMGCHGLINGLRVAQAIAHADPSAIVLVVAVELCSLHYQYGWDPDRVVANALFADGSGAMVITGANAEQASAYRVVKTGSSLIPGTRDSMTWKIGNHGFEMTLAANVPHLIETHLAGFLQPWLEDSGYSIESIQGWAVHPGGPRVLSAVESTLRLPEHALEVSRDILARYGNMSSATLAFILQSMRQSTVEGPWLMLGFGPGLEIEVALIDQTRD